ncbi:MAG: hypothetical protein JWR75_2120 [Devosia sp.]|nr:hypothetical protein [Devosia sp.]
MQGPKRAVQGLPGVYRFGPKSGEVATMTMVILIVGVVAALLGGLWLLQGLGLVVIPPMLCVADCAPLEGPSTMWAVVGLVMFGAGAFGIYTAIRRYRAAGISTRT